MQRTDSWPFILVQRKPGKMVGFSIGHSWSANQRQPHSAKENVDYFLDKETRRHPATAADVPPANREFQVRTLTCSCAAHSPSYTLWQSVQHIRQAMPLLVRRYFRHLDTPLFVSALATEEELLQLWIASPAQADSGSEPWNASDDFDSHAVASDDSP